MAEKRNRSLSVEKRDGIIAKAGELFIKNGFHAVSMDQIATAVPVSKPTLYNHFASKEELYKAVMEVRCNALADIFEETLKGGTGIRTTLIRIGDHFLSRVLSPESIALYRVMIGESGNFPELGRIFYDAGPSRLRAVMIDYLKAQDKAGVIKVPDPELSAFCFINMVKGDAQMRALLNVAKGPAASVRAKIVEHAVDIFLKGHGFKV